MKRVLLIGVAGWLALASSGCFFIHHASTNPLAGIHSAQPDKQLFNRAMAALDRNQFTVARLLLQTLINTYPDSQFLARAKMAIGDSWYRQGGTEGLAQADAEYRDFITFFPTMPEASEAQLKIAKIQFRQIQKPDRDPTHAYRAQRALRNFLLNYPTSPLRAQAVEMLRETQEVLATRDFRIAKYYYLLGAYRAAQGRLKTVVAHYPLFSHGDQALALLARSYTITSHRYRVAATLDASNPGIKKLLLRDAQQDQHDAIAYWHHLLVRFPLSPDAPAARQALAGLHQPVPAPTARAIAFNRAEINSRSYPSRLQTLESMLKTSPIATFDRADKIGMPPLSNQNVGQVVGELAQNPVYPVEMASNANSSSGSGQIQLENLSAGGLKPTDTPSATEGSDANDPNALPALQENSARSSKLLTPNQVDRRIAQRLLAAELRANVPDLTNYRKVMAKQQKQMAKLREQQAAHKASKKKAVAEDPKKN